MTNWPVSMRLGRDAAIVQDGIGGEPCRPLHCAGGAGHGLAQGREQYVAVPRSVNSFVVCQSEARVSLAGGASCGGETDVTIVPARLAKVKDGRPSRDCVHPPAKG